MARILLLNAFFTRYSVFRRVLESILNLDKFDGVDLLTVEHLGRKGVNSYHGISDELRAQGIQRKFETPKYSISIVGQSITQ